MVIKDVARRGILSACLLVVVWINVVEAASKDEGIQLLQQLENVFVEIAERVKPAVVRIMTVTTPNSEGRLEAVRAGYGSGVIIDRKGYIVTNNHIIEDTEEVMVRLYDKRRFIGKVIGRDPDTNLAVIKVDAEKDLPVVLLGDSSEVKVGQWAIAVGNPWGMDGTLTVGVVSGVGRENLMVSRYEYFIQTNFSASASGGGGALLNIRGKAIGITTAKIPAVAQGMGFAIPSNMVKNVVEQLITKGRVIRGWLGIGIQEVTEGIASKLGVKEGRGVLINDAFEGGPADKAGLQSGDIIIVVNGKSVDSPQTLSRLIAGLEPGKKAKLVVIRDGKEMAVNIVLAQRPVVTKMDPSANPKGGP